MKRTNLLLTLTLFLLVVGVPVEAQIIGIGEGSGSEQSDTQARNQTSSSPDTETGGRIIPPEDFGKYRGTSQQESDLSKEALIEKIRADSAAMSIRYEERLRQLRSDSEAMRKTIETLRDRIAKLRGEPGDHSDDTTSREPTLKRSDRASTGMKPQQETGRDETEEDTVDTGEDARVKTESSESDEETTVPSDRRMNPNTASLSDLKSIPGLSDRLAERIEWYRREVTPFEDVQDLKRVPGIDRQVFENIREFFHEGPY